MQICQTGPLYQKRERIHFRASVSQPSVNKIWKGQKNVVWHIHLSFSQWRIHLLLTKLYVCVLAQLRVLWYKQKSKSRWRAEKLNKQFWLKPQTNKWAMSPNPRVWHSLLHRAVSDTSLGYSTTDYCSVCFLSWNNLKASMQWEHRQRALQKTGCGRTASSWKFALLSRPQGQ